MASRSTSHTITIYVETAFAPITTSEDVNASTPHGADTDSVISMTGSPKIRIMPLHAFGVAAFDIARANIEQLLLTNVPTTLLLDICIRSASTYSLYTSRARRSVLPRQKASQEL